MLKGPVIGVTGSAGKTTVKEMIAAALSPLGSILKSEGNLNTEYGVPMTWSRLQPNHKAAVIEMAMRGPDQIAHLARMSAPDVGVITSIGSAHIGELGSREAIARAKSELLEALPAGGVAVIPSNTDFTGALTNLTPARVVTVGEGGDYEVIDWRQSGGLVEFAVRCPGGEVAGTVPGIGGVQATNAAMAIAAAVAAGVPPESAAGALRRTVFPEKRMQVLDRDGVTIWLDAYNSSPESCRFALEAFAELKVKGRKIAILGDMLELGEYAESAHREIGTAAAEVGLDELALVGSLAPWIGSAARDAGFAGEVSFFEDAASAHVVIDRAQPGDAILMKASRGIALEAALW
jgi:UDP-N-acetylmuramoyl-tripeptide--D-alanyl-D-alanine ligase